MTRQECLSFSYQPLDHLGGRQRPRQSGRLPGPEWRKVALSRLTDGLAEWRQEAGLHREIKRHLVVDRAGEPDAQGARMATGEDAR